MTASPEIAFSIDVAWKLSYLLTESDDETELSNIEEEKLEEIMQELYKEITITSSSYNNTSPLAPVTSSSPSPSLSPLITINNSESCGASVSDSSATVMAGIEFVTLSGKYFFDVNVRFPEIEKGSPENELCVIGMGFNDNNRNDVVGGEEEEEEEKEMDGCDEMEVRDDQWLARVLSWGPLDLEEWINKF